MSCFVHAALTRAKQLVVVVGAWDAVKLAVASERSEQRLSTLQQRITALAVKFGATADKEMIAYTCPSDGALLGSELTLDHTLSQQGLQQQPQQQQQQQQQGLQQHASMPGRALSSNFHSPKPQHAQHALPAGPGAMSNLLGLPYSSSGSESGSGLMGLRTSKSLQQKSNGRGYGARAGDNGVAHLLSSSSQLGSFNAASPSWIQQEQQGLAAQHHNGFSYSNGSNLAQQVDAFHRQLHI